ncbi:MAG: hypothetical protein K2J95_05620 [Lachnospiraceae bacterium]|nr:hypothetical protein [Lachnospiraceae bacterium]
MYQINISPDKKFCDISPALYGIFFEDINRAGDGGLYAEMLINRAFDDGVIPEDCTYNADSKTITSATGWVSSFNCAETEGIYGWTASGGAHMALTDKDTLNNARKRALKIRFNGGMIVNCGFEGISVKAGCKYRFYMFAKSEKCAQISVSLMSEYGEVYAQQLLTVEGDYAKYECMLESMSDNNKAVLSLSSLSTDLVTIGFSSLFPTDTFMKRENGLRRDLAEKLIALKPAFLRFPGGCIVEGFSKETAHRFEDTIGAVWERRPHWLLWGYNTTNGLGYHEFLQFCEDAGIDAMYVFNCGMTCQARCPDYFDDELVEEMYNDAVHAILYATAPADTEWGAKRALNGHVEPFRCLKYLEIGNENYGEEYNRRYKYFYDKLKSEFPQYTYIATDHTEKNGLLTEMVDDHFYSDPIFFATNNGMYNSLGQNDVQIYVGEYAATIGCKRGNLYAALGEAAFLTGVERNQSKVKMTSYAPLFNNSAYTAWEPDLIVFNNHASYSIPSYYMLKMFAENRGSYVCMHNVITDYDKRYEHGVFRYTFNGEAIIAGSTDENSRSFSADVDIINGRLTVSFWSTCAEGEDQNHYDFVCEDGKCTVIHYNGWSRETICEGHCDLVGSFAKVEIDTNGDEFEIRINGSQIHKATLKAVPHISAVCTVDEATNELVIKIINITERDITVKIISDIPMTDKALITTLTAESMQAGNSFDTPKAVAPVANEVQLEDGKINIGARSVNVVRIALR